MTGSRSRIATTTTRTIVRATVLTAVLSVLGALLGLLRDLLLAGFFGATGETDAFLVAWTVPETASPLLIEGAMAFLMVPIFVRALSRPGRSPRCGAGDATQDLRCARRRGRCDRPERPRTGSPGRTRSG